MKEFEDDNFKFDENCRKLSKRIENTVGKGEIARYEQFLLFPQCFLKTCFPGASEGVNMWKWVNRDLFFPFSFYPSFLMFNPFSNDKFYTFLNKDTLLAKISNLMEMAESFPNR